MDDLLFKQAKEAEKNNDWRKAEKLWSRHGMNVHSESCKLIADSIDRGDAFRNRVLKVAGPEPEVDGDKTDSIKWMAWYKIMSEAHKEYYPTS